MQKYLKIVPIALFGRISPIPFFLTIVNFITREYHAFSSFFHNLDNFNKLLGLN